MLAFLVLVWVQIQINLCLRKLRHMNRAQFSLNTLWNQTTYNEQADEHTRRLHNKQV